MKRSTKIIFCSLLTFVAVNAVIIGNAFATEASIEPTNKADCYSVYDGTTGTQTFFQCGTCVEKTGSPSGDLGTCRFD